MKTLLILSHPDLAGSASQQYLKQSLPDTETITVHHLESQYPDGKIHREREQALLRQHDQIIFQFPLYWYSTPALLKKWQDEVLTENFAYGKRGTALQGKQFGLVIVVGNSEKAYQAGGTEGFSMSAITIPLQAMAKKVGMSYKTPFLVYQFQYLTETEKMRLLIAYQQYLANSGDSLKAKEQWFLAEIAKTNRATLPAEAEGRLQQVSEKIKQYRMELDEIQAYLD